MKKIFTLIAFIIALPLFANTICDSEDLYDLSNPFGTATISSSPFVITNKKDSEQTATVLYSDTILCNQKLAPSRKNIKCSFTNRSQFGYLLYDSDCIQDNGDGNLQWLVRAAVEISPASDGRFICNSSSKIPDAQKISLYLSNCR
jgi:hypothetical protein